MCSFYFPDWNLTNTENNVSSQILELSELPAKVS